jgi:hypothetical protein
LAAPVRREENPSAAREYRSDGRKGVLAEHAWRAAVVVENRRKWSFAIGFVQYSAQRTLSVGKCDGLRFICRERECGQQQEQKETFPGHGLPLYGSAPLLAQQTRNLKSLVFPT